MSEYQPEPTNDTFETKPAVLPDIESIRSRTDYLNGQVYANITDRRDQSGVAPGGQPGRLDQYITSLEELMPVPGTYCRIQGSAYRHVIEVSETCASTSPEVLVLTGEERLLYTGVGVVDTVEPTSGRLRSELVLTFIHPDDVYDDTVPQPDTDTIYVRPRDVLWAESVEPTS